MISIMKQCFAPLVGLNPADAWPDSSPFSTGKRAKGARLLFLPENQNDPITMNRLVRTRMQGGVAWWRRKTVAYPILLPNF